MQSSIEESSKNKYKPAISGNIYKRTELGDIYLGMFINLCFLNLHTKISLYPIPIHPCTNQENM